MEQKQALVVIKKIKQKKMVKPLVRLERILKMKDLFTEIKTATKLNDSVVEVYNALVDAGYTVNFVKDETHYYLEIVFDELIAKYIAPHVAIAFDTFAHTISIEHRISKDDDLRNDILKAHINKVHNLKDYIRFVKTLVGNP